MQTPPVDAAAGQALQDEQLDLVLPSLFLSAATVILAVQDPIYYHFVARPLETLVVVGLLIAVLFVAVMRRIMPLFFAASGALLLVSAVAVVTQPTQLATPVVLIWPIRLALVLLVGFTWAFLLHPPSWLRRALIAFAVPTIAALAFWGGPALASQMFSGFVSVTVRNFAPYYLALDSHDNLYASDIDGNFLWVFNSKGDPQGTISPAQAPAVPTPGPGIIPEGMDLGTSLPTGVLATPTPVGFNGSTAPAFEFCGLAVDPQDNVYTIDLRTVDYKILRFDRNGDITARWPVPSGYEPASGCIAADRDHIYLNSRSSRISELDHNGKLLNTIKLDFQPLGISSPTGGKGLVAVGGSTLGRIDGDTGRVVTTTLPTTAGAAQIPLLALRNGDVLLSDHSAGKVIRLNPSTGKVVATFGEPGKMAGQIGDIGGLAEDSQGRIYVADYRQRVIQRFTPDGKIDAIWWATRSGEIQGEQD